MVDGLDDERASAYTRADQALINWLHTRVTIATKARADQEADAIAGRLAGSVATENTEITERKRAYPASLCDLCGLCGKFSCPNLECSDLDLRNKAYLCPEENTFVFEDHDSCGEGYGRIDEI